MAGSGSRRAGSSRSAGGKADMENRKGVIAGKYFTDGKARETMSFAELKAAVAKAVGSNNWLDAALASGVTKTGKSGMAVGRMPKSPRDYDRMYRALVGIRPETRGRVARRGMLNGIDIHRDFRPWAVFGLNPRTATKGDVESAYRRLAKQVHPDAGGRRRDFERLKLMRDSVVALMD